MLCDTHCHLSYMDERGENLSALISSMSERAYRFVLDIGTKPGDFSSRVKSAREASGTAGLPPYLHFFLRTLAGHRNDRRTSVEPR